MSKNQLTPFIATHPGKVLKMELEAREGLNQKKLADIMGVSTPFINDIIKGKRSITAQTAVKLEAALEIEAMFWMNMQAKHDIDVANIKLREESKILVTLNGKRTTLKNSISSVSKKPKRTKAERKSE